MMFHEAYERIAPEIGYETRSESSVPWPEVPETNRRLMILAANDVITRILNGDVPAVAAGG